MFRCTPSRLMLLLAVSALAGCDCGKPQPTCTDAMLVFTLPDEGATVPSTFDAAIAATVNGEPFAFDAASLSVQGHTFSGAVSNGTASFTGVTATAGSAELKASIAAGSCSKTVTRTVTVREDTCTAPTVLGLSFPQDTAAPLGVLNAAEIPAGTALQVRVEAGCVSGVQVRIKRGVNVVGDLTDFVNGVATITLPTLPDADAAQYDLFAELVRNGAAVNQPVGAALGSIRVQRSSPSCALSATTVVGPAQDAQPAVTGFQARVSGTMAADSTGTIEVVNVGDAPVTPNADGDVSADFTLPAQTASYALVLTCVDSAGNTTTASGTLQTDFDAPTVTVLSPANNSTVTESPLTMDVSVGQGEAGGLVQVLVNGQSVDAVMVDDTGLVHPTVSFSADGTYTLTVRATDAAGNSSEVTVTVTVALSGCGIRFTRPASSPALLTPAQLQAGNYSFQTTSKPECAGLTATLFRTAVQADGGLAAEEQVGTATLATGGVASFSPLMMSNGSYRFRGALVNPGDAGVSGASIQVTVDLDGPSITNPVVPTGQSVATLSSYQDTQPGTPGVQRTLDFSARVPVDGRVDVCATQAIDPVSNAMRPTSAECGSGWFLLQQGVTSPSPAFTFPEGSYSIKIVVVGGGVSPAPESAAVGIFSDGTKPCVQANSITLPQDLNGDGRLNIAELNGAQPVLDFVLGCGDTSATLSAATPVTVRDLVAGTPSGARAATAVFANGHYTVTLGGTFTAEVELSLFIQLTDQAFNQNGYVGVGDPAGFNFRVDPVVPSCTIASPSANLLGLAQVPGGALDVTINTSTDVTSGVHVTFTGQAARDPLATQGTVTTQYTGLTGDSQVTITATCTDESGNTAPTATLVTRIDLTAPTCDITAPSDGTTVTANEVQTTVALTGVNDGDIVILTSSLSGIASNQLTVAGGSATRLVRYPKGAQTVTATLADEAGNECVAPLNGHKAITLTVNNASCSLDFATGGPISTNTNGSWLNRAGASLPVSGTTPTSASVSVGAVTSDCGAGRNVYLYAGPASTMPSGTPLVTNASGAVTFPAQAFNEGGEYTVTIDDGTGLLTHRSFIVSLKAPTISAIGLQRSASNSSVIQVQKDAPLTFGAFTGNRRVATAVATDMVFGDLNASVDGADLALSLSVIDGATVSPFDATVEVLGVTAPVSQALGSDTSPTFSLKLPHQVGTATVNLVIRVTSPAGNTYTSTHVSQVDVVAPAALTVAQTLGAARTATVNLSWAAVNDDGTNAASGAPSYDVRWTTSSVPGNNSLSTEADFFGSAVKQDGLDTAASRTLTLPPLNTYFIAARAVDEVGNYSNFAAPTALANGWSVITVSNPSTEGTPSTHRFGQNLISTVSLNGDAIADLVIASPNRGTTAIGSVFIYWGGVTADTNTCSPPACQELRPYDSAIGLFGTDISASGNVGDVAGEGKPDLVVSQPTYASSAGRAFLFFGSDAGTIDDTNFIEFRGASGSSFASAGRIIRDLNADGLDEIAFSAHTAGGGQGFVYIFKGRSAAQWTASRSADDGAGHLFVPATDATWTLAGPTPPASGGNQFGRMRYGFVSLGDITGDGSNDFVVPMSKDTATGSRVFLFNGGGVAQATAAVPSTAALQELVAPSNTNTGQVEGFGRAAAAGGFVGATATDLFVSNPRSGTIHLYADLTATGAGNPSQTIQGSSAVWFGYHFTVCDLNGDAKPDVVAGEGVSTANTAHVLWQRTDGSFDNSADGVAVAFWQSTLNDLTSGSWFGRGTGCSDATGDGVSDVIVGDEGLSRVKIFR